MKSRLARYLPCLQWGATYDRHAAGRDSLAAVIVTLMLIPQSLAYAMLAGLPAINGLYASILPLVAYTLFGTSRTLSVGPVAVISLMPRQRWGRCLSPAALNMPELRWYWHYCPGPCCWPWRCCAWAFWRIFLAIQ